MLAEISRDLVKKINEPLDPTLIRSNYGGEKYITGYTVVRLLNSITNGAWDWKIDEKWVEPSNDGKNIYHMIGTLTLKFDDGHGNIIEVKKQGTAGKALQASTKNAENIYKSLETLALRKAASYAGIGAELWLNDEEQDFFEAEDAAVEWTDELRQQYKDDFDFIERAKQTRGFTDDIMDQAVAAWSSNKIRRLDRVGPDKIHDFAQWIRQSMGMQEETPAA